MSKTVFEFTAHTVFEVEIDRRVQEELGLSDDDVARLIGRPRYKKGWSQPKKGYSKKKKAKKTQSTVMKSEDTNLF